MAFNNSCVFCSKTATVKNKQGFAVCPIHKEEEFPDMKCACGSFLNVKTSRYGAFFLCPDCGPISLGKAFSMNEVKLKNNEQKKEITLRSDEVDFL